MHETIYSAEGEPLGVHEPDEDMTGASAELFRAIRAWRRRLSPRPIIYCSTPRPAYARRTPASSPASADDEPAAVALLALAGAL